MVCEKCGYEFKTGERFCGKCGSTAPMMPVPVRTAVALPKKEEPVRMVYASASPAEEVSAVKRRLLLIIGVLCSLMVVFSAVPILKAGGLSAGFGDFSVSAGDFGLELEKPASLITAVFRGYCPVILTVLNVVVLLAALISAGYSAYLGFTGAKTGTVSENGCRLVMTAAGTMMYLVFYAAIVSGIYCPGELAVAPIAIVPIASSVSTAVLCKLLRQIEQ